MKVVLPPCPDSSGCTAKRLAVSGDRAICAGKLKTPIGPETYSLCLFSSPERIRIMMNEADRQALIALLESL